MHGKRVRTSYCLTLKRTYSESMSGSPPEQDTHMADTPTGTARGVKVLGIIALVVIQLFIILTFTRRPEGGHGPRRHIMSGNTRGQTPPEGGR